MAQRRKNLPYGGFEPLPPPCSGVRDNCSAAEGEAFITSRPWFIFALEANEFVERCDRIPVRDRALARRNGEGRVTRWWKERGEWSPGWKWSHEKSSPEPEELADSDTNSIDFTPSELDALDAIDRRSSTSPEESGVLALPPTPCRCDYHLEQRRARKVAAEPRPAPRRSARIAARNAAHPPPPPTARVGAGRTRAQRAHPASPPPPVRNPPSPAGGAAAPKKRGGRQPRKKQNGGIQKPATAPVKREKTVRGGKAAAVAAVGDDQAAPAKRPRRRPKSTR